MEFTGQYAEQEMLRRAVTYVRSRGNEPCERWVAVMDLFHYGSTTSANLCRHFGLDPFELVDGTPCQACQMRDEEMSPEEQAELQEALEFFSLQEA